MEGSGTEFVLVDVGDTAHPPAIGNPQQTQIGWIPTKRVEQRHGVQSRSVVMDLPLDPAILSCVQEVPVTPRVAVVSPTWASECGLQFGAREIYTGITLLCRVAGERMERACAPAEPAQREIRNRTDDPDRPT
jgi:hypothetical protein